MQLLCDKVRERVPLKKSNRRPETDNDFLVRLKRTFYTIYVRTGRDTGERKKRDHSKESKLTTTLHCKA